MFQKLREPVSGLTHFFALLAAIPFLVLLSIMAYRYSTDAVVSMSVFGVSVILLYLASSLYHMLNVSEQTIKKLKRIDHMMIFVLIAGTYTPICTILLKEYGGNLLLSLVWGVAIVGILLKIFWMDAPRWLSTLLYVFMGWLVLLVFPMLTKAMPFGGIALLAAGGILYTIGAVIYALKKPKLPFTLFGFHEIFHLFVIAGTACHIVFMYLYVLA